MKIHHICIQTDNYNESIKFYKDILRFSIFKETKNFHKRAYNTWLELDSFMIELQTNKENQKLTDFNKNTKGINHICFIVDDVEKEYLRIKELGYNNFKKKNNSDIYIVENEKLLKIIAPEGTIIEIRDTQLN
ncbi:VOC family protein [Clostridiaceae bacterium HSG29]|nr:VOC family protein [Clostridiaceae bacterium HSG29]